MVYSAKHREYQLVAKSTEPCFFNSCYFHNVVFFTVVCPRCAPGIGGTTQIWGARKKISRRKKISGASRRSLCPQLQNRVGAYEDTVSLELIRRKDGSIVSIGKFSEMIMSKCSSLMLWNLQLYYNSFEWKNVTFSGGQNILWPLLHIFRGSWPHNPQDLRPCLTAGYLTTLYTNFTDFFQGWEEWLAKVD